MVGVENRIAPKTQRPLVQIQPPQWGNILSQGRIYMQSVPPITIFPGLAIAVTVFGLNLAGDGLLDFLDPWMKS